MKVVFPSAVIGRGGPQATGSSNMTQITGSRDRFTVAQFIPTVELIVNRKQLRPKEILFIDLGS